MQTGGLLSEGLEWQASLLANSCKLLTRRCFDQLEK